MIYKKIYLKDINNNINTEAYFEFINLKRYDSQYEPSPLAVILPGGGYEYTSSREADPIAIKFLNLCYATLVVHYTCTSTHKDVLYPYPYLEVISAIKYIYDHQQELHVDMTSVNVMGFSAGGHLAATYGYLYKDEELLNKCRAKANEVKPTSICLGYATILPENPLRSSIQRLTGGDPSLVHKVSVIEHIDGTYPKTFIWGTNDDNVVPSIHSKTMDAILTKYNVKHMYINYPHGPHGLSTSDSLSCPDNMKVDEVVEWICECHSFIEKNFL